MIAAVNGVAAGAGANIALACDIVVAKKTASFIQAFSKIGLIPDSGGTYFLPRLVGMQKAMALMMTGDKVSADEAERMNMIYKVFEEESFEDEAMKLAENLATMPTRGLGLTKKAVNLGLFNSLEDQLDLAARGDDEAMAIRLKSLPLRSSSMTLSARSLASLMSSEVAWLGIEIRI